MHKVKFILFSLIFLIFIAGCQTINEKTKAIVEKENQKLSKFIGKSVNELKIDLGNPDEDFMNEKGNLELVYKTKKYGIPCERKFEVNQNSIIIGFISRGCFWLLAETWSPQVRLINLFNINKSFFLMIW